MQNLPQHVVIVPDGNRRWARQHGLAPWRGHLAGAETTKDLLQAALDMGLKCVSIWGGSWENLTERSKIEVKFLIKVYEQYIGQLIKRKELHENEIKVNIFGRWREIMPQKAIRLFEKAMEATQNYNKSCLNLFIAYNGTDETIDAVKNIVKKARLDKNLKITPALFKKNLWTGELPPVDFLIRTGSVSDPHNSKGFMMWHCAESQLYFAKEFYPDFKSEQFIAAIKDYQGRERRKGK